MCSDGGGLDHNVEPVFPRLSADPFKLNEGNSGGEPLFRFGLRATQMDSAQLLEAFA